MHSGICLFACEVVRRDMDKLVENHMAAHIGCGHNTVKRLLEQGKQCSELLQKSN